MNPTDQAVRGFVREMQRMELTDVALRRLAEASGATADALASAAAHSLFDTEPSGLSLVLEALALDEEA